MRSKIWCALGWALLVWAVAAQAQEGVALRYQFLPGESRVYDLNVTGGGQIGLSGLPMGELALPVDMIINGAFEVVTREVDPNGDGHLGVNVGPIAMAVTVLGRSVHVAMDLQKGMLLVDGKEVKLPERAEAGMTAGAALSKLTFVMSPQGGLTDVEGMEDFLAAVRQAGPRGAMSPAMMPNFKEMLKGYSPLFPEKPVAPGEGWEQLFRFPVPGQTEPTPLSIKYNLEKLGAIGGHKIARIGLAYDWELKDLPLQAPAEGQPSPGKIDRMAMASEGQLYFDVTAGFLHSVRMAVAMDMEMTTTMPLGPPVGQGQVGAGGPPRAEGEPQGGKVSIKGMKLYYNLYPRGERSAATEM